MAPLTTISKNKVFILLTFTILSLSNLSYAMAPANCAQFPFFEPKEGPLAVINCDFHQQYEQRVADIIKTFGAPSGRPVILNLGGKLILKRNGQIKLVSITPAAYHNIKSFEHIAFTIFLTLSDQPSDELSTEKKDFLRKIQTDLQQAINRIPQLNLTQSETLLTKKLADLTLNFIKQQLIEPYNPHKLSGFYAKARPLMLALIKKSAEIELNLLDKSINSWLATMSPAEKKRIGIVVATAHQARAEEISLQYFAKKFGLSFGVGARHENGFVVMEDKFDEESALKLLARHYLDREAAQMILNNKEGLQRDLLADVAKKILARHIP